ncbi:MAG: hypothetical protein CMK74_00560 [Pseudomonadales bacterium]|nr:hypothetical protein [Pseudomonadales bacterium]
MDQRYATETQEVSAQLINSSFLRKLEEGREKEAADEGSAFIRTKMRQESYAREVIHPITLEDDQIDRDEDTDQPKKIVEKEPDSVATFVTFQGTGPRTWFRGKRFAVKFGKTESERFTKSKFELMTYQNDIRKILSDNSVKDMADEEDKKFTTTIDDIVALNAAVQLTSSPSFNSSAFRKAFQAMVKRRQPIGKILMTKELYYEALDLPATSVGDAVASRHYDQGIEEEEKLWGIPVISTMKSDILNAKKAYVFAPEDFLGCFFLLQDATLYIKQEADIVEFWSYAAPGMGIGNTLAMQVVQFT